MKTILINLAILFTFIPSAFSQTTSNMLMVKSYRDSNGVQKYSMNQVDINTGTVTQLLEFESPYATCAGCSFFDGYNGQYFLGGATGAVIYDVGTNTIKNIVYPSGGFLFAPSLWNGDEVISTSTASNGETAVQFGQDTITNSDGVTLISTATNTEGTLVTQIGSNELVNASGDAMISTQINEDGVEEIHIGENSLITMESGGVQQLWAEDASGNAIDINIKQGTNLLINGSNIATGISTNTANIATNTGNIATNTANIATNTGNIATNTANIATNTANIATNTGNIATNTANIANLNNRVDNLYSEMNNYSQGIADAIAMSQFDLSQPGFNIGVGVGRFQNETRPAIGFGYGKVLSNGKSINLRFSTTSDNQGLGFSMNF